ncbi:hypothetical protein RFI_29333, partial [Reticulomyxa filosa]
MLASTVEGDERKLEIVKEFSKFNHCYNKDWFARIYRPNNLLSLTCGICRQIANNAVELHCDEHEEEEQAYLFGEECLENYLKNNNNKCPIQQHDVCKFYKNRTARKQIEHLLAVNCQQSNYIAENQKIMEIHDLGNKSISINEIFSLIKDVGELKEVYSKTKKEIECLKSDIKQLKCQKEINENDDYKKTNMPSTLDFDFFKSNQYICFGLEQNIHIWNVDKNELVKSLETRKPTKCVKFSLCNENVICYSLADQRIFFSNFITGEELGVFKGHNGI